MNQDGQGFGRAAAEADKKEDRVRLDDASAESEFVKRYSRSLYLLLLNWTDGDEFLASECTQEALLITLEKMQSGGIRKPEQILSFLKQTAKYVSVNYYRKQQRFVSLPKKNIIFLGTQSNGAEKEIYSGQIRSILKAVMHKLSRSRDQEILNRFFLLEQEKKEICECLKLSSDHFDRVLYRAKKRVRKILNNNKPLEAILYSAMVEKTDDNE